jgi:CDP-2,3-bis-(O-geranylgeranyl)-sn-glycerol synthase
VIIFILQAMYFMLPAYIANMAPVFFRNVQFLAYPVDFNIRYKARPLLGMNKTYRGLVFGVVLAVAASYVQYLFYPNSLAIVDYSDWLPIGFLLGFGALSGDLVKSFFKRRLGIRPGERFIPWDQIDYSIGALVLVSFVYAPKASMALAIVVLGFFLHLIANHIGYYLGIKGEKW